jgi:uncharacterized protein (DUF4415 family)
MARKQSGSSVRGRRAAKNAALIPGPRARHVPDSEIEFSDIPESTDAELKRARRVGRPKSPYAKQLIAIRIDPRLLARLRRLARRRHKPYQTMIHELLERAADRPA